jgi:magnesium-transporting ATPase (P-type)
MTNLTEKAESPKKSKWKLESKLSLAIAIVFSILAIALAGLTNISYVPLSDYKAIDITIIAVVFASLIGGYRVGIPLAIAWSLTSWCKIDSIYLYWPIWVTIITRMSFTFSLIWVYSRFKRVYKYSPYNVYRAIICAILLKNILSIPFDIFYRHTGWAVDRFEQTIIEVGICVVAMSLLIKHLREIHILNGVKKKTKKGDI